MMLTRRTLLASSAATLAAGALPAFATTPHSFKHGAFALQRNDIRGEALKLFGTRAATPRQKAGAHPIGFGA